MRIPDNRHVLTRSPAMSLARVGDLPAMFLPAFVWGWRTSASAPGSLFKKSRAKRHVRNTAATAISPSSEYLASPPQVLRNAVEASNLTGLVACRNHLEYPHPSPCEYLL